MQYQKMTAVMSGLLLGTALLGASTAYAKPDDGWRDGPDARFDPRMERMTDQLDLSDEQKGQIKTIMEEARKAREQQRLEVRKQIEAVLTDEQKTKRESMLKDRLDRRLERMAEQLDLSDEQIAKMRTLFEEEAKNPELSKTDVRERVSEILTEDQRSKLRDHRRPPHRSDRGNRPDRCDRPEPSDRPYRGDRPEPGDRPYRGDRSEPGDRGEPGDRPDCD